MSRLYNGQFDLSNIQQDFTLRYKNWTWYESKINTERRLKNEPTLINGLPEDPLLSSLWLSEYVKVQHCDSESMSQHIIDEMNLNSEAKNSVTC